MQDESFENLIGTPEASEIIPQEPLTEVKIEPTPWPFWPTIGFSTIIAIAYVIASLPFSLAGFLWVEHQQPDMTSDQIYEMLMSNGFFLAVTTCVLSVPVIGLSFLFAFIRKNITLKDYFCLNRPSARQLIVWLGATIAIIVIFDASSSLTGREIVPQWMVDIHETSVFLPLLWVALIIAAPLAEETLFRGFLFNGILHSKLGTFGALFITSSIWAAIHTQYDIINISHIFVFGLVLGYARIKTGSLYIPIAMHMLMNFVSTIELSIKVILGQ